MTTSTSPRTRVRPSRYVRFTVGLRQTTKSTSKVQKGTAPAGQTPTLALRVSLPAGVRYVKSAVHPKLKGTSKRNKVVLPTLNETARIVTWENVGMSASDGGKPSKRKFRITVLVDSSVMAGTVLSFGAELFELVPVGAQATTVPACPRVAPNATVVVAA